MLNPHGRNCLKTHFCCYSQTPLAHLWSMKRSPSFLCLAAKRPIRKHSPSTLGVYCLFLASSKPSELSSLFNPPSPDNPSVTAHHRSPQRPGSASPQWKMSSRQMLFLEGWVIFVVSLTPIIPLCFVRWCIPKGQGQACVTYTSIASSQHRAEQIEGAP